MIEVVEELQVLGAIAEADRKRGGAVRRDLLEIVGIDARTTLDCLGELLDRGLVVNGDDGRLHLASVASRRPEGAGARAHRPRRGAAPARPAMRQTA